MWGGLGSLSQVMMWDWNKWEKEVRTWKMQTQGETSYFVLSIVCVTCLNVLPISRKGFFTGTLSYTLHHAEIYKGNTLE